MIQNCSSKKVLVTGSTYIMRVSHTLASWSHAGRRALHGPKAVQTPCLSKCVGNPLVRASPSHVGATASAATVSFLPAVGC